MKIDIVGRITSSYRFEFVSFLLLYRRYYPHLDLLAGCAGQFLWAQAHAHAHAHAYAHFFKPSQKNLFLSICKQSPFADHSDSSTGFKTLSRLGLGLKSFGIKHKIRNGDPFAAKLAV